MNITVYSVGVEFAVSEAYTMFRTMGLRHLPVVNHHNRVKGMITKKDLIEHSVLEKYKELKRYENGMGGRNAGLIFLLFKID